jgi:hypothetical protein
LSAHALAADEYIDVDDGARAIAAAELVAAALGHGSDHLPTRAKTWLVANEFAIVVADLALARRAVLRVLAANSELRQLWDEGGSDNAWLGRMRVLVTRLVG